MAQNQQNLKTFNDQFVIKKKISQGSFGIVYLGYDLRTSEQVAIKVEKTEVDELMSIEREISILRILLYVPQIPRLLWAGKENGSNVMILQLLGRDLTHYIKIRKRFTLQCVLAIADQMFTILENIHNKGVVHRDIKPENILVGRDGEQELLYLVDYGISKQYKENDEKHIPFRDNKPFLGTSRYASIAAHKGHEISRKDDLESLGYVLLYLLRGNLPWQNVQYKSEDEKVKLVGFMKMRVTAQDLCKDYPQEFARYIDLVRKMSFREKPDYRYFQQLFKKLALQQQIEYKFDWQQLSAKRIPTGSNSPRKKTQDSHLIKQIYSPVKRKQSDPEDLSSARKYSDQKNSIVVNNLMPERPLIRHKSTSSYNNEEQYSDFQPDGSVMVAFQRAVRFGSFHCCSPEPHKQARNTSTQNRISHKLSLDIKAAQQASIAEINLGLLRQFTGDIGQNCETQLNEDESPHLAIKNEHLIQGSVEQQYKNPFQINKKSDLKKRKRNRIDL